MGLISVFYFFIFIISSLFFFGGMSIHLSTAMLAHLFSYDMYVYFFFFFFLTFCFRAVY